MKTKLFSLLFVASALLLNAQTSTETFETESNASTNFTDNGVIFKIISHISVFDIQASFPGTGWSGTNNDNRYIDNSNDTQSPPSFSIMTTSYLFKVSKFWMYLSALNLDLNVSGTLTVTGKLNGVTKFTQTKTTGFATSLGTTNGYTLIDLTNLNGQNYSNIVIDELELKVGGNFKYVGFDAFTWTKDSGMVLGTQDVKAATKTSLYPNPAKDILTIDATKLTDANAEIYDLTGKLIRTEKLNAGTNPINISQLEKGNYLVKIISKEGISTTKVIKE